MLFSRLSCRTAVVYKPEVIFCFCATIVWLNPTHTSGHWCHNMDFWRCKNRYQTGRLQDGSAHSSSYLWFKSFHLKRRCKSVRAVSACYFSFTFSPPSRRASNQEMVTDRVLAPGGHKNYSDNEATPSCQMWQEESWFQQLCSQSEAMMTDWMRDLDSLGDGSLSDGVTTLIFEFVLS